VSGIILATEYTKLPSFAKNWCVKPKPPKLGIDRQVRGHVTVRHGHSYLTDSMSAVTYDNPEEMLKGMHQATDKQLQSYRFPDQESFKNEDKQFSRAMWSQEFVRRITKLNPRLFVQDSKNAPGCAGWYKMIGKVLTFTGASFRHGLIPEFTIMKTDKADLVTEFVYGWRGVNVLRLLFSQDITWNQVMREFGDVPFGDERGKHWWIQTAKYRT
jgi:hypothetical protein